MNSLMEVVISVTMFVVAITLLSLMITASLTL